MMNKQLTLEDIGPTFNGPFLTQIERDYFAKMWAGIIPAIYATEREGKFYAQAESSQFTQTDPPYDTMPEPFKRQKCAHFMYEATKGMYLIRMMFGDDTEALLAAYKASKEAGIEHDKRYAEKYGLVYPFES